MPSELGGPPPDDDIERRRVIAEAEAKLFDTPRAPVSIGRFEVRGRLGTGGQGVVYLAFDPELDREVALKLLRADPSGDPGAARERLLREARAMARLAHPNVVHVYEVGLHDDRIFIAMEHVAGTNARAWLATAKPDWRAIMRVYADAGRGLVAAHAAGIVHRDIKPENILVAADGRARVADFGIANDPGLAGTPHYMAPEQRAGVATAASDQYALARSLDEALPVDAPPRIRRTLDRALAADPAHRFPSLADFLVTLETPPRRGRLRIVGWSLLGIVLAIALAGAVIQFWMFRDWMNQAR